MNNDYTLPSNALRNTDYDLLSEIQEEFRKRERKSSDRLASKIAKFLKVVDEAKKVRDEIPYLRVTI